MRSWPAAKKCQDDRAVDNDQTRAKVGKAAAAQIVIAGIDGGGTKTQCLMYSQDAQRLGWGAAGPLNTNYISVGEAKKSVRAAVSAAAQTAGLSPNELRQVVVAAPWSEELVANVIHETAPAAQVAASGEDVTALMGGWLEPHGLVLTAGTGSRCAFVPPQAGGPIITGAWGSLFGDEGSGYTIGAQALRAATRVWDDRGPHTGLAAMISDHWGLTCPKDVVRHVYGPPAGAWRSRIASLCPLVGTAAASGDKEAAQILDQAAMALAEMVGATARQACLTPPYRLLVTGGVFNGLGALILKPLGYHLEAYGSPTICLPGLPAVAGAVLLAAQHVSEELHHRVLAACWRHYRQDLRSDGPGIVYNGPSEEDCW